MTLPLALILGWLALTTLVGVLAGLNRRFGMEEFFVGGRSFGTLLFYAVAAAEIYSAFAFLGLAGWAFEKGLSIVYALGYMAIAYSLYFVLGPRIQRLGARAGYVTQPDFLEDRYASRPLAGIVAAVGVVFIIPYLQLQLLGAGIIVQIASGGAMDREGAILLAVVALVIFVSVSGLRGIGWTNLMQAAVMLVGMISVGLLVPLRFYGGIGPAFDAVARLRPENLSLPDAGGLGIGWYASAVLLSGFGAWMWPHIFAATYSARSESVVRRNAGILPLYQLAGIPVIIVGLVCAAKAAEDPVFAAAVEEPDHAMLVALVDYFPPWIAGAIGAGGLAASISTASALILTASNLMARNVLQKGVAPGLGDERTARIARVLVAPVAVIAAGLALLAPDMLVQLLLLGYSGIAQLAPAVFLGIFTRLPTKAAVSAGLVAGVTIALVSQVSGWTMPWGLHAGFVGLLANLAIVLALSPLTRRVDEDRLARFESILSE